MAQFDNNDFTKYDYYKNVPSGPYIDDQRQGPVGGIRGLDVPVTRTNPSIAKQMEDLETEIQMAFENVAALNTVLEPILGSAAGIKSNVVGERPLENDSASAYFQRMRYLVSRVMELNDEMHKIRARIQL